MKKIVSLVLSLVLLLSGLVIMPQEAKASADYSAIVQFVNGDWSVNYQNSNDLKTTVNGSGDYTITITPKDLGKEGETIYGIGFMKLKLFCAYKELKVAELSNLKITADGQEVALDASKIVEHTNHWSDDGTGNWYQDKAWLLSQNWEDGGFGPVDIFDNAGSVSFAEKLEISFTLTVNHSATWVGKLSGLNFVDDNGVAYTINDWDVTDTDAALTHIGDGVYAKTFKFAAPLTEEVSILSPDDGYKVAFDGAWDYNFGKDGVVNAANISLTIPAGTSEITILVDEPNNKIYDSINNPTEVDSYFPEPTPNPDDSPAMGDFDMVLPLVLVFFGGAIVVVASKKRFA